MRAVRCAGAAEFLDQAGEFLLRDELRNNLLLGLAALVAHDRPRYDALYEGPPFFGVVTDGARVVSAAMRTPPFGVGIAATDASTAVAALAPLLHDEYGTLPGANGTRDDAAAFATAWERLTGQPAQLHMSQRIYQCRAVVDPTPVPGRLRPAAASDLELLVDWYGAFRREALGEDASEEQTRRLVSVRVQQASAESALRIWEDGDGAPVTLVGFGRATPNGIAIAPVWTPAERRRQGFATAATAATTRELLAAERRFVYLYTDLANPTSNSIYQAIGYRAVCDAQQWVFAEPEVSAR